MRGEVQQIELRSTRDGRLCAGHAVQKVEVSQVVWHEGVRPEGVPRPEGPFCRCLAPLVGDAGLSKAETS